jgi:hypothetical protein
MSEDTILTFSVPIEDAEKPPLLPPGDYPAVIRGVQVKLNKNGEKYVPVSFTISPEHFPVDFKSDGFEDGKIITYNRLPGEDNMRSRWQIKKFTKALGIKKPGDTIDASEWIGLNAIVTVGHSTFAEEEREEISLVKSADE